MTAQPEVFALPQSWSLPEVCSSLGVTTEQITKLIRDGRIGYFMGSRRSRRFTAEHVGQIVAALEVKPASSKPDDFTLMGLSPRSAAIHRNRAIRGQS